MAIAGTASAQICGVDDTLVVLSLDGNTVAAAATDADLADQAAADAWWAANVYDASLVTVCDASTPVCQYDLDAAAYGCIAECAAPIDMDALVAGPAITTGIACYPSTPTSESILVPDSDDTATSTEVAGAECSAWITDPPEEGCTEDDIPSGDDATDDDYMAYITLCQFDPSADDCADDTACA